jgi:hypothetical protein
VLVLLINGGYICPTCTSTLFLQKHLITNKKNDGGNNSKTNIYLNVEKPYQGAPICNGIEII